MQPKQVSYFTSIHNYLPRTSLSILTNLKSLMSWSLKKDVRVIVIETMALDLVSLFFLAIYYVTERCKDGWFKGANRQQKTGVFPGNYVTVYKGREPGQSSRSPHPQGPSTSAQNPSNNLAQITLPALPPRDSTTNAAGVVWTKQQSQSGNYIDSLFGRKSGSTPSDKNSPVSAAPAGGENIQGTCPTSKEKKDSSAVSLMKRLTNIKRSKSPTNSSGGNTNPAYSMDNPTFDDSTVAAAATIVKPNLQQIINPVHVRYFFQNLKLYEINFLISHILDPDHVQASFCKLFR